MIVDAIPLWLFFTGTIAIILVSVKGGFALGKHAVRHAPDEKDSPAAAVGGTVLGLVAFMLAVSFAMVITLIAGLDRQGTPLIRVTQKPLHDVRSLMDQPAIPVKAKSNVKP